MFSILYSKSRELYLQKVSKSSISPLDEKQCQINQIEGITWI